MSEKKFQITHLRVGDEVYEVGKKGVTFLEASPHMYVVHYKDDTMKAFFSPNKDASWAMKPIVIEVPQLVVPNAS